MERESLSRKQVEKESFDMTFAFNAIPKGGFVIFDPREKIAERAKSLYLKREMDLQGVNSDKGPRDAKTLKRDRERLESIRKGRMDMEAASFTSFGVVFASPSAPEPLFVDLLVTDAGPGEPKNRRFFGRPSNPVYACSEDTKLESSSGHEEVRERNHPPVIFPGEEHDCIATNGKLEAHLAYSFSYKEGDGHVYPCPRDDKIIEDLMLKIPRSTETGGRYLALEQEAVEILDRPEINFAKYKHLGISITTTPEQKVFELKYEDGNVLRNVLQEINETLRLPRLDRRMTFFFSDQRGKPVDDIVSVSIECTVFCSTMITSSPSKGLGPPGMSLDRPLDKDGSYFGGNSSVYSSQHPGRYHFRESYRDDGSEIDVPGAFDAGAGARAGAGAGAGAGAAGPGASGLGHARSYRRDIPGGFDETERDDGDSVFSSVSRGRDGASYIDGKPRIVDLRVLDL